VPLLPGLLLVPVVLVVVPLLPVVVPVAPVLVLPEFAPLPSPPQPDSAIDANSQITTAFLMPSPSGLLPVS
jgi:hypothetical protein